MQRISTSQESNFNIAVHIKNSFSYLLFLFVTQKCWIWGLILAGFAWEFLQLDHAWGLVDEQCYITDINRFLTHTFTLSRCSNVWPGYAFMMASIVDILPGNPLSVIWPIRLIALILSFSSVVVFHSIAKQLFPFDKQIFVRTLQYTFFPLVFPFFGMIYTDIGSVLFCLLAFERGLAHRPVTSALACAIAISIRQTNIVWTVFIWLILIWQKKPLTEWDWHKTCKQSWPFVIIYALFLTLISIIGTVALGSDRQLHPVTFNLSNVYFCLIINFFIFLPLSLRSIKIRSVRWKTAIGMSIAFAVYIFTFTNTHHYNITMLDFFLHNRALNWLTPFPFNKALAFLPAAGFFCVLRQTSFADKKLYFLYPFSFFALVLMPLIEPRYYIIPSTFFLLFRRLNVRWIEWMLVVLFAGISLTILRGMSTNSYFL